MDEEANCGAAEFIGPRKNFAYKYLYSSRARTVVRAHWAIVPPSSRGLLLFCLLPFFLNPVCSASNEDTGKKEDRK